eukprot:4598022-Alexandrium_andersonii.AAC.1
MSASLVGSEMCIRDRPVGRALNFGDCWAISQDDPTPALQDFIDFGDVSLHDGAIKVDAHFTEHYN